MNGTQAVGAAWGISCALATLLQGQQRPAGAELWGRVLLAGDTVALPATVVEIVGSAATTTSSQTGFYRFPGLPQGVLTLRARRLGYESVSIPLVLHDGEAERRDIMLVRLPNTLTEVRIEGQLRKVPARYQDVYRRMSTANGHFFTREDIDRLNPLDIHSLLQQVPTVRVNNEGVQFARCEAGGAYAMAQNTSGSSHRQSQTSSTGSTGVHIYIDGMRMTGRGSNSPMIGSNEHRVVLRSVSPAQIQAIEMYSGVSRIPGEFLDDACAVIAIWTKSY